MAGRNLKFVWIALAIAAVLVLFVVGVSLLGTSATSTFSDVKTSINLPRQDVATAGSTSDASRITSEADSSTRASGSASDEHSASGEKNGGQGDSGPAPQSLPDSAAATANRPPESSGPAPPAPHPTERILLLAPTNPVIVELQLSIDGQPHAAALQKLMDEVLKVADSDADGRVTWKELTANKRVKYGQFGNLAIEDDNGEKQVIDRYDIDQDGLVDRTELPRFLTRNAGGARSFSVRGTLDHVGINRRGAATWRILDADDDGALSPSELTAGKARLAGRDSDDDEILVASDLDPRLLSPDPEMMNEQRRRRGPDAIRLLGPNADWSNVQLALEQAYGGSHYLRPASFPLTPELFSQLDGNGDGRINENEFPRLNDVQPHLVVAVSFGKEAEATESRGERTGEGEAKREGDPGAPGEPKAPVGPKLRLVRVAPALGGSGQNLVEQPGRLTLSVGQVTLTIYTNDTVAGEDFSARAKQALAMFDNNKDGYLVKDEVQEGVQAQLGQFEAVDADEDGKAFPAEIEAFLSQQQAGLRAQIHARAGDQEDALFAAIDADHDERLDSREVEGMRERLMTFDQNHDGQLSPDELPEVLVLGFARGSIENLEATFRPPPIIVRATGDKAPKWFTSMDANADGVISKREFLGSTEAFTALDANADGLFELAEALKAESQKLRSSDMK